MLGKNVCKTFQVKKPGVKGKILNDNALSFNVNKSRHSIPVITEKTVRILWTTSDSLPDKNELKSLSLSVNKVLALINQSRRRPVQKS